MAQKVTPKTHSARESESPQDSGVTPPLAERGKKLARSIDDLVSEIDAVLEENAEEMVKGYVQRGGE